MYFSASGMGYLLSREVKKWIRARRNEITWDYNKKCQRSTYRWYQIAKPTAYKHNVHNTVRRL